jgi:hypothetical protein
MSCDHRPNPMLDAVKGSDIIWLAFALRESLRPGVVSPVAENSGWKSKDSQEMTVSPLNPTG